MVTPLLSTVTTQDTTLREAMSTTAMEEAMVILTLIMQATVGGTVLRVLQEVPQDMLLGLQRINSRFCSSKESLESTSQRQEIHSNISRCLPAANTANTTNTLPLQPLTHRLLRVRVRVNHTNIAITQIMK